MIKVILGLSLFLIVILIFVFIHSVEIENEYEIILLIFAFIISISIIIMSCIINNKLDNFDIIEGNAKYNEVLYIKNNDTIKLYEVVKINEDNKK